MVFDAGFGRASPGLHPASGELYVTVVTAPVSVVICRSRYRYNANAPSPNVSTRFANDTPPNITSGNEIPAFTFVGSAGFIAVRLIDDNHNVGATADPSPDAGTPPRLHKSRFVEGSGGQRRPRMSAGSRARLSS